MNDIKVLLGVFFLLINIALMVYWGKLVGILADIIREISRLRTEVMNFRIVTIMLEKGMKNFCEKYTNRPIKIACITVLFVTPWPITI
jgi:hypothetical protein